MKDRFCIDRFFCTRVDRFVGILAEVMASAIPTEMVSDSIHQFFGVMTDPRDWPDVDRPTRAHPVPLAQTQLPRLA